MCVQVDERVLRKELCGLLRLIHLVQEVLAEQAHVLSSLAQARQVDLEDRQPVQQIGAQVIVRYGIAQGAVRRRHHSCLHGNIAIAANAAHRARLKRT